MLDFDVTVSPPSMQATNGLKDEVAAYKRRRIVEEAVDLFYTQGYESTTLDAVAERLNVTKPFIYSYFKNKGEVLAAICETGITLVLEALEETLNKDASATDQLKLISEQTARIIISYYKYTSVYTHEEKNLDPKDARRIRELRHQYDVRLRVVLEKGKASGEFDFEDSSHTSIWVSGVLTWIAYWYREGGHWSSTEVVMDAIKVVMRIVGLREPGAKRIK